MNFKKALLSLVCVALAVSCFAQMKMPPRGKAELSAGTGSITVDYGRPELKGRDMLSQLQVGQFWRMGMNQAAVLSTPVDLTFGSIKIPKGAYSIWLKLAAPDKFELVFNSQTGQWGMQHDVCQGCLPGSDEEGSAAQFGGNFHDRTEKRPQRRSLYIALGHHRAPGGFPVCPIMERFETLSLRVFELWKDPKAQISEPLCPVEYGCT